MRGKLVCLSLFAAIILSMLLGTSPAGAQVRPIFRKAIPTITIVYPNGGENLNTGADYGIVWRYSGISDNAMVQIALLKNKSKVGEIVQQTPIHYSLSPSGTGAFKWKVASIFRGTVGPGCAYRIRVSVLGAVGDRGDSAMDFCIVAPAPQMNLVLQTPNGGERWPLGTTQKIVWNSTGINSEIRLSLWQEGHNLGLGVIARVPASAGSYDWKVGVLALSSSSLKTGGAGFKIHIESPGGEVHDQSVGSFEITSAIRFYDNIPQTFAAVAVDQWIKVTAPAAGAVLKPIDQFDINWECSESMKKKWAKFILLKGGQPFIVLMNKAYLNSGHNYFQLPGDGVVPPGDYQIRIESLDDPGIKGDSGLLHVVAKVSLDYKTQYAPTTANRIMEEFTQPNNHNVYWDHIPNSFKQLASEGSFALPPDPGSGAIRVGVVRINSPQDGCTSWSLSYRSFIHFDFDLKGKVKSAKLTYDETIYPSDYPINFYPLIKLESQWNGNTADLFGRSGMFLDNSEKLKAVVQSWIDDPATNFGMVMTAVSEGSISGGSSPCDGYEEHQSILQNVKLVIVVDVIN